MYVVLICGPARHSSQRVQANPFAQRLPDRSRSEVARYYNGRPQDVRKTANGVPVTVVVVVRNVMAESPGSLVTAARCMRRSARH